MAAYSSFINDFDGRKNVSFDGIPANAGQCVQSVAFYVRDYLHLPVFYADAARWFTDFERSPLVNSFQKIPNNPNDPNQLPEPGDIIVWGGNLPNSGGAGHIAVFLSAFSGGFISFDSNWAGKYCHQVSHNWSYVLGWLHPNNNQGGTGVIIGNGDNWFGRANKTMYQIRGRQMSREEFAPWVGQDSLHLLEAISDNPEADAATHAQEVGFQAIKDNWPGQIHGLEDQLKKSQDIANQLNQAVVDAQNANKQQLQDALAKVADLTAQLQTANDKLVDIQKQQASDQSAGDSFLRRLGQFVKKYFSN